MDVASKLGSLESDFADLGIPERILKDEQGNIVDDCICSVFWGIGDSYVEAMMGEERGESAYYSAASILFLSLSAVCQSFSSKPRFAPVDSFFAIFTTRR